MKRLEWTKLVNADPKIRKDQIMHIKYLERVNRDGGCSHADLWHLHNVQNRLEKRLERMAKKYNYIPEGYVKYVTTRFDMPYTREHLNLLIQGEYR